MSFSTFECVKDEKDLWATDLEEVDGLSTNIHFIGDVSQEERHTIFHIL